MPHHKNKYCSSYTPPSHGTCKTSVCVDPCKPKPSCPTDKGCRQAFGSFISPESLNVENPTELALLNQCVSNKGIDCIQIEYAEDGTTPLGYRIFWAHGTFDCGPDKRVPVVKVDACASFTEDDSGVIVYDCPVVLCSEVTCESALIVTIRASCDSGSIDVAERAFDVDFTLCAVQSNEKASLNKCHTVLNTCDEEDPSCCECKPRREVTCQPPQIKFCKPQHVYSCTTTCPEPSSCDSCTCSHTH